MKTLTLKNLKLTRKRTIVTIVGIILATALLSALVTLVSSFQYSMIEYQKQKDGDFHVKFSARMRISRMLMSWQQMRQALRKAALT